MLLSTEKKIPPHSHTTPRMSRASLLLVIFACGQACAFSLPPLAAPLTSRAGRCAASHACAATDGDAPDGDAPDETPGEVQCSGARIVTELGAAEGADALSQRFSFKLKALKGDFSPEDEERDTEEALGAITEGLIGFPSDVPLRVVAKPSSSGSQAVVDQICAVCSGAGMAASGVEVRERLGGKMLSVSFVVRAASASALSELSERLRADPTVKMVF